MCSETLPVKALKRKPIMTLKKKNVARMTLPVRPQGRPAGVIAKGICVKAWRTIRALAADNNNFTLGDVLDIVATGNEKDAPASVLKYLCALERHGVLGRRGRRDCSGKTRGPGHVVWQLRIDLGWFAPVWRQGTKVLWDPNANAVVALPKAEGSSND